MDNTENRQNDENNDIKRTGSKAPFRKGRGLTRRQFLSYALGGTGAFMAMTIFTPLVAFAVDPLRRLGGKGSLSATTWRVSDFNEQLPTHVTYTEHIDDAWNSHDIPNDVYVIVYQNKLMIMSHVCTHLGCHVNGSYKDAAHKISAPPQYDGGLYWFHCPCHGSLYNIYGVNSPTSPAPDPLSIYTYEIVNGYVHVGPDIKRTDATWDVNPNPTIT